MTKQAKLTTKIAAQVKRAKKMIAKVEAAEKAGVPKTEANMRKLGYVRTEGGVWELPIPIHICKILVAEDQAKRTNKNPRR